MATIYLCLAAACVIWAGVLLRWGGLLAGCLVVVVLASCFGFEFYSLRAGPLPMTSDRAAVLGLGFAYLFGRIHGWIRSAPVDRMDLVFGLFLLMLTASTLAHDWRFRGAQPLANLLFLYAFPAAVYWLAREATITERRMAVLYGFLGIFSVYLAVTAVAETRQLNGLIFPRYIVTTSYTEWLGRGRGPFLNPATNGIYMATGLCAWALFWPQANRLGKTAVVAAMGVVLLGVYCTLTRSCWIGAFAGLGVVVFSGLPRQWRLPILVSCLLVAAIGSALLGSNFTAFKRDKNVSEYHMAQSARLRPILAQVAINIVHDYPLFGCGFGQYKKIDGQYAFDRNVDVSLAVAKQYVQHNVFLSVIAETGFVGLGLFLAVLAGWLGRARRIWTNGTIPYPLRQHGVLFGAFMANWSVNGLFHDTSLMMSSNLLMFLLAGICQGIHVRATCAAFAAAPTREPAVGPKSRAAAGREFGEIAPDSGLQLAPGQIP